MISIQQKIYNHLLNLINSGELPPNEKLPPESELCKLFETSRCTVRKAYDKLANQEYVVRMPGLGSFVSEKKMRKNLNVGVIVPDNDVFSETSGPSGFSKFDIFNGFIKRAHETGTLITLAPALATWHPDKKFDGYLLLVNDEHIVKRLIESNKPCVGSHLGVIIPGISNVSSSPQDAYHRGIKHLINLGHKKIGLVDASDPRHQAFPTYIKTLSEYGLKIDESIVRRIDPNNVEEGVKAFKSLLAETTTLDACFFRTDFLALEALKFCLASGIDIPNDLSIMAYGNTATSDITSPKLTTMDPQRGLQGYLAMKKLEEKINFQENTTTTEYIESLLISGKTASIRRKDDN